MTEQQTEPAGAAQEPQKRPLFRPEAVEHHARARLVTGGGLDLRERRTTWLFRGLLVAIAVAVLLAFTVHVDRTVTAQAVADGSGTVQFALPQNFEDSLRVGQEIRLRADGRELPGRVTGWREAGGGVVVSADVPDAPRAQAARVVLDLDRRSVAEQLLGRS